MSAFALAVTARLETEVRPLGLSLVPENQTVAIAVSGGGDSLCLLHLCHDWAKASGRNLHVLTVDHKLRQESADEAEFVAALCRKLAIAHHILTWDEPRASQAAARQARHRLLAQACQQADTKWLLLGHTLDDVAETMAMRVKRGVAPDKQAGPLPVSVSPVWPEGQNLTLLRPLILERRASIRNWLKKRNIGWIDDPSNANTLYERARQREALKDPQEAALLDPVSGLHRRLTSLKPLVSGLRRIANHVDDFGLIVAPTDIADAELETLLSILIPAAAGHDRPPRAVDRKTLVAALREAGNGQRFTLGGAWIERKPTSLLIGREPGTIPLKSKGALWDGRFESTSSPSMPEDTAPFLVRHALPPGRNWRCIIAERLETQADIIEQNSALLPDPTH